MKQVTSGARRLAGGTLRRGFTTIELMIAVVILAIVLSLAFPSYQGAMRKSRRTEAFTALSTVQQAQERHRSTNTAFTTLLTAATTATPPGLGLVTRTPTGYYDVTIGSADATTYVATATAVTGTSQAADGACAVLAVRMDGGNVRYGSGASIDWTSTNTDPQRCWAR
ncbi:MAG: prepilin-type N-terminal cleavage/methylation domain-containing protein [Rubrivivax sp.]|nr:prepilin-type N-terminal cleavage/methylation domain-containing protein [Rubrivivax sp.]